MADAVMITVAIVTRSGEDTGTIDDVQCLWNHGGDELSGFKFKPAAPGKVFHETRPLEKGTDVGDIRKVAIKILGRDAWLPKYATVTFLDALGHNKVFYRSFGNKQWLSTDENDPREQGWAKPLRFIWRPNVELIEDDTSDEQPTKAMLDFEPLEERIE